MNCSITPFACHAFAICDAFSGLYFVNVTFLGSCIHICFCNANALKCYIGFKTNEFIFREDKLFSLLLFLFFSMGVNSLKGNNLLS